MKNTLKFFIIFFLLTSNLSSKENEKIKFEDVNDLGNPSKIKIEDLPEGMQKKLSKGCKAFKCMHQKATKIMANSFSKSDDYNNKYPDNMIKAMAYFELFYLGQLYQNKNSLKKYKENYKKEDQMNLVEKHLFRDTKKKNSIFNWIK